jgi:organic radical activating enzyme
MSSKKQRSEFENQIYVGMEDKLNKVGSGMCLAKWSQVTLHLQTGHNHSCHHPRTHKISKTEIKRNPSALHNTKYKKMRRREMLTGKRPKECDYCWAVEDNSDRFSDRIFKSAESWSAPHFDEIVNADWRQDFNPRYVEVAFSNTCNFKCSYCAPAFSSTWMEEIQKHGAYPTTDRFNDLKYNKFEDKMPIPNREYNPYVEAFWKWWPDLYHDLHTFRITGGEPLLSKDTWKVLDYVLEQKEPKRSTYNALSVPNYTKLIDGVFDLKRIYASQDRYWNSAVFLDSSYLRYPLHQTAQVLPRKWDIEILRQAQLTDFYSVPKFDKDYFGYSDIEIQKIKRIYDWTTSTDEEKIVKQRYDFGKFFKEHDKRRGTNFRKTFPELEEFYNDCLGINL